MKTTIHVVLDAKEVVDAIIEFARRVAGPGAGSAVVRLEIADNSVKSASVDFQRMDRS